MKNMFYFSRRERLSLCMLALVIVVALTGLRIYESCLADADREEENIEADTSEEVRLFMAEVSEQKPRYKQNDDSLIYAPVPFDPNTCDSSVLLRMGLRKWQVRTFLKYRSAGARFYGRDDLLRVYSLSKEDVERMMPYAHFPVDERVLRKAEQEENKRIRDSLFNAMVATFPQKLKEGEMIDLSEADTSQLKKIPGVGSYYAGKILRYGERLGGFVSVSQLKEIEGLPEDIEKWVRLSTSRIRKLNINKADFKTLIRHPYLNYEQVKAIFNHRNQYGDLKSLRQLSTEDAFSVKDFERFEPYIAFE